MRTFVKFDEQGNILATCRMESLPEGLEQPYIDLAAGESAIEVEPSETFAGMSCLDIHEKCKVDVNERKLVLAED